MKKRNLKNEIYAELRSRIVNFILLPGDRISDKEISYEMGISRTPVREALVRLSGEGLVQAISNRGFRVKVFTIKEIRDLYTLRESLEVLAIRLAAPKLDEDWILAMGNLMKKYPDLIDAADLTGFNNADEEFHHRIARKTENNFLDQMLTNLQGQIRIVRRYQHLQASSLLETYDEHTRILEHMIRGEITDAQRIMSKHIMESMLNVVKIVGESIR